MRTTSIGKNAEEAVANLLTERGYVIIDRNWRTKICEIDIVAKKDRVIYFIEVKYRSQNYQGEGFDYITPSKLKQMKFSAGIWCVQNSWEGDYRLMAASVGGSDFSSIDVLEI